MSDILDANNKTKDLKENYSNLWHQTLKPAIQNTLNKNTGDLEFENLYRQAYNMVLYHYAEVLYTGTREVVIEHLTQNIRGKVVDSLNSNFVAVLKLVWNDHQAAMIMIRDILMYMERVYVARQKLESVYDFGIRQFCDHIVRHPPILAKLTTVLNEIDTVD